MLCGLTTDRGQRVEGPGPAASPGGVRRPPPPCGEARLAQRGAGRGRAQGPARGAYGDTYLLARQHAVEQALQRGVRAGQQLLGLRHDVLGDVRPAQELCHLLAEVVAVVFQQVIR